MWLLSQATVITMMVNTTEQRMTKCDQFGNDGPEERHQEEQRPTSVVRNGSIEEQDREKRRRWRSV